MDILLADLLRSRGFEVITTQEAGNIGKSDAEQIDYAIANNKVMLTHNRVDFEIIHKEYLAVNKQHFGIIVATRHKPHRLAKQVLTILNHVAADDMENQLRYI